MADPRHRAAAEPTRPEDRGQLTIADKVVERVASIAAAEIEAVTDQRSGWNRLVGRSLPRSSAKVAGGRARVAVEVAAAWPSSLPEVSTRTRDHVRERVTTLTGISVVAVDVTVADVVHLETSSRRVE